MSQINNIITTTFRASGGNVVAQLGGYASGFRNIGGAIDQNVRSSTMLNNQWRALGTTIRYAVAGSAVFGLTRMVGQLKQVQQQLGLIAAIGSQPGPGGTSIPFSNSQINQLYGNLQNAAVNTLTPVSDVNDAVVNLLSTVSNVKRSEIPDMITQIGQAAKLAQTPIEDLTKASSTMNIAFGRPNNSRTTGQFTRQWFALISKAPGGISAAPEIANQLSPLASMFQLSQFASRGRVAPQTAQAQMMSLVLASLRTGATPSTGLRGLTYLLQSILQPTGKAKGALASIGITPQNIAKQGIYANLMKLLHTITGTNAAGVKTLSNMDDSALPDVDSSDFTGNLPGISPSDLTKLRQMIPRIHGIRAAVILASQLTKQGDVESLGQDLTMMQRAQANQLQGTLNMARAWQAFQRRSRLQAATVAINAMALQVASTFEPVLNFAANRIVGLQHVMSHHRTATGIVAGGGAAMLAALGIGKYLGVGRLLRGGGSALVRANAAQAAMAGSTVLGGSPQNPMYVVVVGQLFGGAPKTTIPGGGGGTIKDIERATGISALWGGLKTAGRFSGRIAKSPAGVVGMAATLAAAINGEFGTGVQKAANWYPNQIDRLFGITPYEPWKKNVPVRPSVIKNAAQNQLSMLQRMFGPNVVGVVPGSQSFKEVSGRADVFLTLDISQNGKVTRKKVHIPMDMWSGGRHPSTGGNPGRTRRGGN